MGNYFADLAFLHINSNIANTNSNFYNLNPKVMRHFFKLIYSIFFVDKELIPVKNKHCNVVYAENQKEYLPLPVLKEENGNVTSEWKMCFRDRIRVLFYGRIFITQMTFNDPLQPIRPNIKNPIFVVERKEVL